MTRITIDTGQRCEFIDITDEVANAVRDEGMVDGIVLVYCPHTTAGITINENADPAVAQDMTMKTAKLIEYNDTDYRHGEGNSDSHIKSSIIGASEMLIVEGGKLLLGTWQSIYFAEFDGPRSRNVLLKTIQG